MRGLPGVMCSSLGAHFDGPVPANAGAERHGPLGFPQRLPSERARAPGSVSGVWRAPRLRPEEQAPCAAFAVDLRMTGDLLCGSGEGVPGQERDSLSKYVLT